MADEFFVRVERARAPHLAGRPVIIGGGPRSRSRVVAASVEAWRAGVGRDMSMAEALERCPSAVCLEGSLERYLDVAAALDEHVRRVWPRGVEWLSVDEAAIDPHVVGGEAASRIFAQADEVRGSVRSSLGLDVAFGVATSRVASAVAARLARPCGLLHVLSGYEARFLANLDLSLLPCLSPIQVERLRARGIDRIGPVADAPLEEWLALAPPRAELIRLQARGLDPVGDPAECLPRTLTRDVHLDEPARTTDAVTGVARGVALQLAEQLRRAGGAARLVTIKLGTPLRVLSRSTSLAHASPLDEDIVPAVVALISAALKPGVPVHTVGVTLGSLQEATGQLSLFDRPAEGESDAGASRRARLIAMARARLSATSRGAS